MNVEKEVENYEEDETVELNIEEITDVQGGIETDFMKADCGLGCYLGAGY